jgi:Bacterial TniB protein
MDKRHTKHSIARALRGCFGKFPHVNNTNQRLDDLLHTDYTGVEPESIFILGDTGVGKSTLLTRYCRQHPRVEHATFTEVPILYAEVPSRCTIKMLAGHLLKALGSPFWNRGDEVERTHQLVTLIQGCKVQLVILDEVNHLVDRGREKSHYEVSDWIKQLITATNKPFVLSGIPRARKLLSTNEQLADRFGEVISIKPFTANADQSNSIASAMGVFKVALGDLDCIDLTSEKNAERMAMATAGRLRGMRRLMVRAVETAFEAKVPKIDLPVLAHAFEKVIYVNCPPKRNPFRADFDGHPLTRANEPYAPRLGEKYV